MSPHALMCKVGLSNESVSLRVSVSASQLLTFWEVTMNQPHLRSHISTQRDESLTFLYLTDSKEKRFQ